MDEVKILICGNVKKEEIYLTINNLKSNLNLDLIIKDISKFSHSENIEYYFSLINDMQYFNAFILNFEKKEDIFLFFNSFNSEDLGITNGCYPFFVINEQKLSKMELKNFIKDMNNSKEDDYKIKLGNFFFFNEKEEFQDNILNIYNCYKQESNKIIEDSGESINILIIGVKNSGKSSLINRLLFETRALSMENHYTTKLNTYKHKKYSIVFYDISGFHVNEDEQIKNVNNYIDEFNNEYKNIKNKIHTIFYVIDVNSSRILQNKEKELIENIFKINIPIFIVGQKAKITNIKNFIRKTKFELNSLSKDYKEKIETLSNRIFCLDSSKKSVIALLKSVYDEFLLSKQAHENIINLSSKLSDEEIFSDNESIKNHINDINEKQINVQEIYRSANKSLFFNNFIEALKEVNENFLKIKEKYSKQNYFLKNFDKEVLNKEINDEFLKLFSKEDLKTINNLINERQNDLANKEKEIVELKCFLKGSNFASLLLVPVPSITVNSAIWLLFLVVGIFDLILLQYKNRKTKEIIDENIGQSYKSIQEKYIKINIILIIEKAEKYNKIIDEFNKYINEFENEDFYLDY